MDEKDILELLNVEGEEQEQLFSQARAVRNKTYGSSVIVRGVTEITNLCRVNCDYCPMRRENTRANDTYFMDEYTLLRVAEEMKEHDINVVLLQAGEVPQTTRFVGEAIPKIRKIFNDRVEILLNLGLKKREEYAYLKEQGATSYILKHETSDQELNERIRHESYEERIQGIRDLLELGFKVGTGMIIGLPGQSLQSIARDMLLAKELGVHMCSPSPFIPAPNTPFENAPYGSTQMTLNALAIMRLLSPAWLIASVSALEKSQQGGQFGGLAAGANVVTVNFTPQTQRNKYLIYGRKRFVVRNDYAHDLIKDAGLTPSHSLFVPSYSQN